MSVIKAHIINYFSYIDFPKLKYFDTIE